MFYCNAVSTKLNTNFNDLFNNNNNNNNNNTPSPSSSSASSSSSATPLVLSNSSSPSKDTFQNITKLQKLDFNNINVQNQNNSKLMASIYYQTRDSSNTPTPSKRKIMNTDFDDATENIPNKITALATSNSLNHTSNNNNNNSTTSSNSNNSNHSNSNNFQIISTKPIETQYVNSKCAMYIYYKVDLATAIDDHFKKSFNTKNKNKIFQLGKNEKSGNFFKKFHNIYFKKKNNASFF